MARIRANAFVFPSLDRRSRGPLGNKALAMVLRRMGETCTVHGFRSAFRDWAGDQTHFPREIAETSLGHVAGDATERAYRRLDALQRRGKLMEAWASCIRGGKVVRLRTAG
jgi:integrase